jgi:hypothetical protein
VRQHLELVGLRVVLRRGIVQAGDVEVAGLPEQLAEGRRRGEQGVRRVALRIELERLLGERTGAEVRCRRQPRGLVDGLRLDGEELDAVERVGLLVRRLDDELRAVGNGDRARRHGDPRRAGRARRALVRQHELGPRPAALGPLDELHRGQVDADRHAVDGARAHGRQPRIRAAFWILRYAARCLTATQGRREAADRARRAEPSILRLADADAACVGSDCVRLTSERSCDVAFAVFVDFAACAAGAAEEEQEQARAGGDGERPGCGSRHGVVLASRMWSAEHTARRGA